MRMSRSGLRGPVGVALCLLCAIQAFRLPALNIGCTSKNVHIGWRSRSLSMAVSSKGPGLSTSAEVIKPDYRVAGGFFGVGVGLTLAGGGKAGIPLAAIGAFLASRTQKVRFVFDNEAMEVLTLGKDGELELSGENFAVGGRNRWAYKTFTNWEFYPSPQAPILVYFKETQTRPEGQIHFFPVLGNPQDLLNSFRKYIPLPGK